MFEKNWKKIEFKIFLVSFLPKRRIWILRRTTVRFYHCFKISGVALRKSFHRPNVRMFYGFHFGTRPRIRRSQSRSNGRGTRRVRHSFFRQKSNSIQLQIHFFILKQFNTIFEQRLFEKFSKVSVVRNKNFNYYFGNYMLFKFMKNHPQWIKAKKAK